MQFTSNELYSLLNSPVRNKYLWLAGADLSGADLRGAPLNSTVLIGANLSNANLSGANLQSADLRDADLREADLRGAALSDAKLRRANLTGATLEGAEISLDDGSFQADFSEALLIRTNLRGAQFGSREKLERAASLEGAIMPDGTVHE